MTETKKSMLQEAELIKMSDEINIVIRSVQDFKYKTIYEATTTLEILIFQYLNFLVFSLKIVMVKN